MGPSPANQWEPGKALRHARPANQMQARVEGGRATFVWRDAPGHGFRRIRHTLTAIDLSLRWTRQLLTVAMIIFHLSHLWHQVVETSLTLQGDTVMTWDVCHLGEVKGDERMNE